MMTKIFVRPKDYSSREETNGSQVIWNRDPMRWTRRFDQHINIEPSALSSGVRAVSA